MSDKKSITKAQYLGMLLTAARDGTFPGYDAKREECLYRGPGKTKCAIGILLSDVLYTTEMESEPLYNLVKSGTIALPQGLTLTDLYSIQATHDNYARHGFDNSIFAERVLSLMCFRGVEPEYDHAG